MLLVVDANILVAEALRERGQALFADATLELLVTDMAWAETQRVLRQRIGLLSRRGQINPQSSLQLFAATVSTLLAHIGIAPAWRYTSFEPIARRRIPRDPDDWPTVALALALDAQIWTIDADFLGCGLPTWTTDTLLAELAATRT